MIYNKELLAVRKEIGDYFKLLREKSGISHEDLATILGVNEDAIKNIEDDLTNNILKGAQTSDIEKKPIGVLNKKFGIKGYDTAMPGHVVYEMLDRYVITLLKSDGNSMDVPFYKENLKSIINFYESKTT